MVKYASVHNESGYNHADEVEYYLIWSNMFKYATVHNESDYNYEDEVEYYLICVIK